jgi:hypothetical protein
MDRDLLLLTVLTVTRHAGVSCTARTSRGWRDSYYYRVSRTS